MPHFIYSLSLCLTLAIIGSWSAPRAFAQKERNALLAKVAHATILITSDSGYQGSGVVTRIMKRKYVLTAHHVVEGGSKIKLLSLGDQSSGTSTQIHGWHRLYDIAVYPLPQSMQHLPVLRLSDRILPKGEKVAVAAFPGGNPTFSLGVIRDYRTANSGTIPTEVLFTADVDKGASGGMIIDKDANLIGIVTAYEYYKSPSGYKTKGDSVGTPAVLIRKLIQDRVKSGWRP
jgi:S1-C subfamily serine protease